jgi:hypothetical protein
MSRKSQCQTIERLVLCINGIIENRCSLSDKDVTILSETLCQLQILERKKGKTNKEILETVVELLTKFFK